MKRFTAPASALAALFLLFSSCSTPPPAETRFVMGTICSINLFTDGKPELYRELFDRLSALEQLLSANSDYSELASVNRAAGISAVKVRPELLSLASKAVDFAERSGGAFDPTIGPLVKLWGIGGENPRIPEKAELERALSLIDWREVEIDRKAGTLFLKKKGMALDLGAIAKGYAADELEVILSREGVARAVVDLGGNIYLHGKPAKKDEWTAGIQDPSGLRGSYLGTVHVGATSLVTSGSYERFFESGGRRYHHILSTVDGYPVENGLVQVTILCSSSTTADALSTSCFALGWEKGRALVESVSGASALFVWADGTVRGTGDFLKRFTLTNAQYRMAVSGTPETAIKVK